MLSVSYATLVASYILCLYKKTPTNAPSPHMLQLFVSTVIVVVLLLLCNDTSILVDHFVSSPREREGIGVGSRDRKEIDRED